MQNRSDQVAAGLFVSLLLVNCGLGGGSALLDGQLPPEAAVSETIRAILDGGGPPLHRPADLGLIQDSLATLYTPAATAVWTRAGRPTSQAAAAVGALQEAGSQGLVPEDYDAAWLCRQLDALSADPGAGPTELALFDTTLSVEVLRYLRAVHSGRVRPTDVGFAYHIDLQGADLGERLRRALAEEGVERLAAELEPRFAQYARLKRALARHRQLPPDAATRVRVRKIELALERLRWLPDAPEGRFLVANVPAFRVVAFRSADDERPALQMAIVVGKAARTRTPLFADELSYVVFRPSWYPPPSILRNEIVPRLERDPGYLRREHMDLVAVAGDTSAALAPTAANLQRLRSGQLGLRQNPGNHNALGLVKFVFPNDYRVYMHDTPARSLFARARRDFSHGCIRVERPARLAEFVLSQQPGWTLEKIEAAMKGTRTLRVDVVPPIPVFVFYTTVIVRADDTVEFFDDIYGLDARLDLALTSSEHGDRHVPQRPRGGAQAGMDTIAGVHSSAPEPARMYRSKIRLASAASTSAEVALQHIGRAGDEELGELAQGPGRWSDSHAAAREDECLSRRHRDVRVLVTVADVGSEPRGEGLAPKLLGPFPAEHGLLAGCRGRARSRPEGSRAAHGPLRGRSCTRCSGQG